MQSPISDFQLLAERVERLERQNRLLKRGGLAALVCAASLIAMGQARPNHAVEAQNYILTDASGHKRAELALESSSPVSSPSATLQFFDEKGDQTLFLSPTRLELGGQSDQGKNIVLDDAKGVARANLGLAGEQSFVLLNDAKGVPRLRVDLDGDKPFIVLQDAKEVPRLGLSLLDNEPMIGLSDTEGFEAVLGNTSLITTSTGQHHQTSAASLVLFGKDGTVLWSAP
jgi:hypothetical protein